VNEEYRETAADTRDSRGGNDVLTAAADRFFEENSRAAIKRERERMMKTKGVFVPVKWARRWDFVTAGYLAHFAHYAGTQGDPNGYDFDSARDIQRKTGMTPDQQKRCRKILEADRVIDTKTGGIGNKVHVRVNIPLLMMWDELPSYDEAVEAVMASMDEAAPEPLRDNAEPPRHNAEPLPEKAKPLRHIPQTHNCNSSVTRSNSSQGEPSATETSGRLSACLEVLDEVENFRKDRKRVSSTLEKLICQYPNLDPVLVCKQVRDYASTQAVKNPSALLGKFFESDEAKRASEPRHPHGAGTPVFRAEPTKAETRARGWPDTFEEYVERNAANVSEADLKVLRRVYDIGKAAQDNARRKEVA
jgi:hypothetical protein